MPASRLFEGLPFSSSSTPALLRVRREIVASCVYHNLFLFVRFTSDVIGRTQIRGFI